VTRLLRLARGVVPLVILLGVLTACSGKPGDARIHVLGRDYDRGGSPMTLADVQALQPRATLVRGGHEVGGRSPNQPTVIYVEAKGQYFEYSLEGGP
jgi:hypothetical protein